MHSAPRIVVGRCSGPYAVAFECAMAKSRCVGVHIPPVSDSGDRGELLLHHQERALAQGMKNIRRREFVAGRLALRSALTSLASPVFCDSVPITRAGDGGPPLLPRGLIGSISHKNGLAVAIATTGGLPDSLLPTNVAHASGGISIGIDLELASASAFDTSKLARRVLTVAEHADASVRRLDDGKLELELALELELKLRFSLKEAVFKALFPIVQRHVGFAEVEVRPLGNGTCELSLDAGLAHSLTSILGPKMPFNVAATWGTLELGADAEAGAPGSREQYFLTTAAVRVGQDSNIYNNDPEQGHGKT